MKLLPIALAVCATATLSIAPSVLAGNAGALVGTMMPRRGSLPHVVTAYGTATPELDGSMTVSLQSQGRVLRFDVTAGEAVKAGQPLLEFGLSQSALGTYQQAETALNSAQISRVRLARLLEQRLATNDQLTQADKAVADARTALDTLRRSGADKAKLTMRAPFDGVVATIPVAQGDTIAPGAAMMTLMRADGLVVGLGIEPAQRSNLKRGDPVILEPLTSGEGPVTGTLVRIGGLLNPRTRLIDAAVSSQAKLLPGAAFRATIQVGTFDGFVVPRDAVLLDEKGSHIFQVSRGKARRAAVTIVGADATQTAIVGAIDPAQPIVLQGNYQLTDGVPVRTASPSASAANQAKSDNP